MVGLELAELILYGKVPPSINGDTNLGNSLRKVRTSSFMPPSCSTPDKSRCDWHYHLPLLVVMIQTEVSDENQGLQSMLKNKNDAIKVLC